VLLTDAEIDHTTGLVILRESAEPLHIYGTETVRQALTDGFPLLRTLEGYCGVQWSTIEPGTSITLTQGKLPGLEVEVFPLIATPPKYWQRPEAEGIWAVGLTFRDPKTGGVITYAPVLAELDDKLRSRFESSDCILVDGTFWHNDELPALGITERTARAMGHLPLSGPDGSLEHLAQLSRPRKILIHINNTNPILLPGSPERQAVEAAGVEVGYDGLTIEL
jgi:pyrroloquinoline quinone biosynthesis protein B